MATPAGFTVEGVSSGTSADFSDTETMQIGVSDGRIRVGQHVLDSTVILRPKDPFYFYINERGFRGDLHLQVNEDANSIKAINHVPIESYLLGVVGAEIHSYWEPEVLKTQAVAARTYCLAIKYRFGPGRLWDVTRTQANQVYDGLAAENSRIRKAVVETTGQILIASDADGQDAIFPTYYSSSCGGHTEDYQSVFGSDNVSIRGVACSWCKEIARTKDFYWAPVFYSMDTISAQLMGRYPSLAKLERIVEVETVRTGYMGRLTYVRLIGANGQKDSLRGEDFRLSLDPTGRRLKSALFTMTRTGGGIRFENGLGFGHGVGLCQCGAQGMARQGHLYQDILSFYYPGSTLVTIETALSP